MPYKPKLTREMRKELRSNARAKANRTVDFVRSEMGLCDEAGNSLSMAGMDNYKLLAVVYTTRRILEFGAAAARELARRAQDYPDAIARKEQFARQAATIARYANVRLASLRMREQGVPRAERVTLLGSQRGTGMRLGAAHEVKPR